MQAIRVKFKKLGRTRYISHLDLNRCMSRAIKRSRIPLWYTQGFNPHPYITFVQALSIFSESECEYMDAKLESEMPFEKVKDLLSKQMPEGIIIEEVTEPIMRAADVAFSAYTVSIDFKDISAQLLYEMISKMLEMEKIVIQKTNKRGIRDYDIKEYLQNANIEYLYGRIIIKAILPSSPQENFNPSCFSAAIELYTELKPEIENILRTGVFNKEHEPFR